MKDNTEVLWARSGSGMCHFYWSGLIPTPYLQGSLTNVVYMYEQEEDKSIYSSFASLYYMEFHFPLCIKCGK